MVLIINWFSRNTNSTVNLSIIHRRSFYIVSMSRMMIQLRERQSRVRSQFNKFKGIVKSSVLLIKPYNLCITISCLTTSFLSYWFENSFLKLKYTHQYVSARWSICWEQKVSKLRSSLSFLSNIYWSTLLNYYWTNIVESIKIMRFAGFQIHFWIIKFREPCSPLR